MFLLSLLACAPNPARLVPADLSIRATTPGPAGGTLTVTPVPVPLGEARLVVTAATSGAWRGAPFAFAWQPLAHTGDRIGAHDFGARTTRSGVPIAEWCQGLDATGIVRVGDGHRMVTHFECHPGAIYVSHVEEVAGRLSLTATRPVDLRPVEGGYYYCAGTPSGWGTHLAAQEYEADVRKLLPDGTVSDDYEGYNQMRTWWDGDLSPSHPWMYGWVVEVPLADGDPGAATERYAMGRFSHEMALVMPDRQTVYLSDDTGPSGALFLFRADRPGDLSAGTLWAARFAPAERKDVHSLSWVSLGHADDAEVEAAVTRRASFEELFEVAAPAGGTCPGGLAHVRTPFGEECLRIRPGMEAAATRLESRRAAAVLGATTELTKAEGLAFAEEEKALFLAVSRFGGGSAAGPWAAGRDDLRLTENRCGGVLRLDLGPSPAGGPGGEWVAGRAAVALAGVPEGEGCSADSIANPDNLAWIAGAGTLAVAEDSPHHANNALWFHDPTLGTLARVLTVPLGAEVSGLHWTPDIGGHGYLSVAVQGPFSNDPSAPAEAKRSVAGVLGPFPGTGRR